MVCAVVGNIGDMGTVSNSNNIWSVLWLATLGTWILSAIATTYGRAVVGNMVGTSNSSVTWHV